MQDIGHWKFDKEFVPDEWFGFIYRITDLNTGQEYIGKKQFHTHIRKAVKGRKNKKRISKESAWKEYTSSSTHVNKAIEENGKDKFIFQIESLHKSKGSLYYAEVEKQIMENVLKAKMTDGTTPKYYNKQIGAVRFIPPDELLEEANAKFTQQ